MNLKSKNLMMILLKSQKPLVIQKFVFKVTLESFAGVSLTLKMWKLEDFLLKFQLLNSAAGYMTCLKSFLE